MSAACSTGVMLGLVLELRHAAELAERRHRRKQPGELGVRRHRRLDEEHRLVGVDSASEQVDGHRARARGHRFRFVWLRYRVVVDDAIKAAKTALQLNPIANGAEVVAEMQLARRLNAREDRLHCFGLFRRRARAGQAPRAASGPILAWFMIHGYRDMFLQLSPDQENADDCA